MLDYQRLMGGFALITLALVIAILVVSSRISDPLVGWSLAALIVALAVWGGLFLKPREDAGPEVAWSSGERFTVLFVSIVLPFAWMPSLGIVMHKFSVTVKVFGYACTVWLPPTIGEFAGFIDLFTASPDMALALAFLSVGVTVGTLGLSLVIILDDQIRMFRAKPQENFE